MCLEIQMEETNRKVIVGVCYRPSNNKVEEEAHLLLQTDMAGRQSTVKIMGDFNYADTDWAGGTAHLTKDCHFLNVMQDNFMG